MSQDKFVKMLADAPVYDLTQDCSIFTPPAPGDKALEVHFFKRVTGAYGGGPGANGQIINWSNTVGTHLVGERSFHSGMRRICDVPLSDLTGEGVVADISGMVSDYSIYTPEMIKKVAKVKKGDVLIINTGYHRYSWDQPDTKNSKAQGGIDNKEFGFLLRHPGPSLDFYQWVIDMDLKWVGVDCGSFEHPMNTPARTMHPAEFAKAEAKLKKETGKSWDEVFPRDAYYEMTHLTLPEAHKLFVESIVGQIDELLGKRAWFACWPIPFMEVEAAWARVTAWTAPKGMTDEAFFKAMKKSKMFDMSVPFSVQSPQWANYEPLTVKYFKRGAGFHYGMGRNGTICNASIHLATHMDGETHFWAKGRTIGQVPLTEWIGPGVIADISDKVSNSSVYTPKMIMDVCDIKKGDILIIKTGWYKYGWISPESDEFRYMIKHPGPSADFAEWAAKMQLKWIGVDCVAADHPMNTIQRQWHPQTFKEAEAKLIRDFGKTWDEMFPLDQYYQDMHYNLFPKNIVHAENLGLELADLESGRYYIGCFLQKAMEVESLWARFVAFKEQ